VTASAQPLTMKNIKQVLKKNDFLAKDAPKLGEYLGLRSKKIHSIIEKNGGAEGNWDTIQNDILKTWHNSDLEISWEVLAQALGGCSYTADMNVGSDSSILSLSREPRKRGMK